MILKGIDAETCAPNSREYIFDGQELHLDRPDYQLCDITDPLIVKFIEDPANLSETYDVSDFSRLLDSGIGPGTYSPGPLPGVPECSAEPPFALLDTPSPTPSDALLRYVRGLTCDPTPRRDRTDGTSPPRST